MSRVSRRKEIIKIRAELNDIKTKKKKSFKGSVNPGAGFFKEINKTDKSLARCITKKRKWAQINKIKNEKEVTNNTTEIQSIVSNYYKQLYAKKLDNLGEMENHLETYKLLKLNQEKQKPE